MHLRYDPLNHTVMSGATSLCDVSLHDLDFIRRVMRDHCQRWNGERRFVVRLPEQVRLARAFDFRKGAMLSAVPMRVAEIELVRPPRRVEDSFDRRHRAMMMQANALRVMAAYNVGDARAAMKLFKGLPPEVIADTVPNPFNAPVMPPLDAPRATPKGQGEKCQWKDGEEFVEALKRRGYRTLGSGAYSTVLVKGKSNRVIKVNRRPDGWLDYVMWAAKHNHMGKNAPMVYSFRRFNEGTDDEFYVAVVERMARTISELPYGERRAPELFQHLAAGMRGRMGSEQDALKADDMQPGSLRFAIEFKLTFRTDLDLHAGNFMIRDDGTVACTDPICGDATGTAPRRWRASSARLAA